MHAKIPVVPIAEDEGKIKTRLICRAYLKYVIARKEPLWYHEKTIGLFLL